MAVQVCFLAAATSVKLSATLTIAPSKAMNLSIVLIMHHSKFFFGAIIR